MKSNRTHKRIIASVLALGVVLSNAAGIIDGTSIFTDNSITASAADISINAEEITLYGIGRYSSYQLPENYSDSFQLKITGAENVTYRVSDKNTYVKGLNEPYKLVDVSSEGLVTIKEVTNYYNHISIDPSWINYIDVTADGKTFSVPVTVINYSQMLANKIIDDAIQNIINNDMTEYQKMSAICKWIADNTSYEASYMRYEDILEHKKGDCIGFADLVMTMAKKANIQCWARNANTTGHVNNMAILDGEYYQIDASFGGGYYQLKKRNSLFSLMKTNNGTEWGIMAYDENFPENFTVPNTILNEDAGENVKVTTVLNAFAERSAYTGTIASENRQQWNTKTLTISEGITTIGSTAFSNAYLTKLETINIPSTVTELGHFGGSDPKNVVINKNNPKYKAYDGFVIENGTNLYDTYGHYDTNTIHIPEGITTIEFIKNYFISPYTKKYDYYNFYIPASVTNIKYNISYTKYDRIYGVPGSYAEEYAKKNSLSFYNINTGELVSQNIIGTITSSSVQDLTGSYTYTGCEIQYNPKVTVDGTVLTKDVDYVVTYSNNINVGTASYTVTGIGSYNGSVTKTFKISQAAITKSTVNITMEDGPFYYTGSTIKPKITITDTVYDPSIKGAKTVTLTEGKDYTLTYAQNVNYWDSPSVTITGINGYSGSVKKTFSIEFAVPTPTTTDISTCTATLSSSSYTYDGTAKTPDITVKNGSTTLKENTDYTVSYSNNVNAGTATAKITGKGSYTGTLSKTYTINKASIGTGTISLSQYSYEYDGAEKKPSATIKLGSKALVSGTDYTVSYSNNTNAGSATVTATGTGNYSGTLNATFYITEPDVPAPTVTDISTCTATLSLSSYTYDGAAKTPTVTVKNGSTTLVNGTDYTVAYSNNTNAGTANVTITGKDSYTGTISKTFTINPANINGTEVSLSATSYTYSGNACKPNIAVKSGSKTLANGTDYTVEYKNNVNVGTATVTITGKGNYSGSLEKTFTISPASISSATATLSATSYTYDGTAKKPTVTVKIGGKTLVSGTDYSVVYSNNVKAGSATVKVNGKGNYTGTVSKSYTINAASITGATVTGLPKSKYYTGKAIKPVLTLKYGARTLKSGTDYTVAYKSNKAIGKATITLKGKGNFSGTTTLSFNIIPKKTTLKTVTSPKTKQLRVTYSKVTNITGYQILYSTSSDFSNNKKTVTTTATSKTISNLKKGTTYYVKVRTYKTVNGTKYYSGYSSVKKVKIK